MQTDRIPKPRLWLAFILPGLLLLFLASPTPANAATWCGDLKVHYRENGTRQYVMASNIHAERMRCKGARRVTRRWARKSRLSARPAKRSGKFRCHYYRMGSDVGQTECRKPRSRMRLIFGAYDSSPYH